jgi:hypothetical protein
VGVILRLQFFYYVFHAHLLLSSYESLTLYLYIHGKLPVFIVKVLYNIIMNKLEK